MSGKIIDSDFKNLSEITSAGGTAAQLLNDTKIYLTANGLNKTLNSAITAGNLGGVSPNLSIQTKTTSYTVLNTDDLILCSGAAFTITLPLASSVSGKVLRIKKTDSSTLNIITIAPSGSDTINALTNTTLNTINETVTLVSDGSSKWNILDRYSEKIYASYYCSANTAISPTNPVNFDTKILDSHNCISTGASTWKFTSPRPQVYQFMLKGAVTLSAGFVFILYKNGSIFRSLDDLSGNASTQNTKATGLIQLNAGDYIDIRGQASSTFIGGTLAGTGYDTGIFEIVSL